ncbi:Uncharacterized protein TCM_014373 [Theobroma cacao]|uniref:Uncharacterized protein n=1 Tax=Theobroma cacao TaxID=3641 RepID=A0A061G584_THECC|nr:Uncharacterized protein TCM_014373 [Theobroma cacao]
MILPLAIKANMMHGQTRSLIGQMWPKLTFASRDHSWRLRPFHGRPFPLVFNRQTSKIFGRELTKISPTVLHPILVNSKRNI